MVVTLGTDDRKHPHIQRLPNAAPWITSSNFHRAQDTLSSRTGGKLGEFIGKKQGSKNKIMRLFGNQHAQLAPVVPLSLGMGGRGGVYGAPGTKKEVRQLDFRLRRSHRKHEIILSASLGRMSPSHSDGLTGEFWGRGVFGQVQTILLGECFFLLAQTPLKLMGILKSPYSTGLDILRTAYFLVFSCPESLKHNRGSVCPPPCSC
jgi:hypothetical protein